MCVFVCALACTRRPGWRLSSVGLMLPCTYSRALVRCVVCVPPGFAAPASRCSFAPVLVPWLWPATCLCGVPYGPAWCAAPRPVRLFSVLRLAFPSRLWLPPTGAFASAFTWRPRGARGGRPGTGLMLPAAGPCRGRGAGLARVLPAQGRAMGLCLSGPSGVGLGLPALRCCGVCGPCDSRLRSPVPSIF